MGLAQPEEDVDYTLTQAILFVKSEDYRQREEIRKALTENVDE